MKALWYFLLVLAVLGAVGIVRGLVVGDLFVRGPVVEATVIGTRTETDRQDVGNRRQSRTFPVLRIEWPPGTQVTLNGAVGWPSGRAFREGDTVRVRVNEVNPADSAIDTWFGVWGAPVVKILTPLVLLALVWGLRRRMT